MCPWPESDSKRYYMKSIMYNVIERDSTRGDIAELVQPYKGILESPQTPRKVLNVNVNALNTEAKVLLLCVCKA